MLAAGYTLFNHNAIFKFEAEALILSTELSHIAVIPQISFQDHAESPMLVVITNLKDMLLAAMLLTLILFHTILTSNSFSELFRGPGPLKTYGMSIVQFD